MSRISFARVPSYDTWTGDKRIRCDMRRKNFVCFVIDLDTLKGCGFRADTLPLCRKAADLFESTGAFPDGSHP